MAICHSTLQIFVGRLALGAGSAAWSFSIVGTEQLGVANFAFLLGCRSSVCSIAATMASVTSRYVVSEIARPHHLHSRQ